MYRLLDFATPAEPVSLETKGAEVYSRFQDVPGALVIAVVDEDNRPVGLIERNAFFLKMAAEYGRALFAGRPVSFVMAPPHIQPADASAMDFMGGALSHDPATLLRGFVVVDAEGRYLAVGAALSLLEASYAAARERIAELAELSTNLAAAEQQAKAASRAKSQFLATMSHEIRTPLNGVLAIAEIVDRKLEQLDLRPYLKTIADSGKTLHRLLTDALDLSRVEADAMTLDPAPIEMGEVLSEIADLWRSQAELKNLTLTAPAGESHPTVMADPVRLKQVLNNLVGNALKFTETGGVTLSCASAATDEGEVAFRITVTDTGVGIRADELERVFTAFAKSDEHSGGAGLGLAICQRIVGAMGGTITAASTPGEGSTFTLGLTLPAACRVDPVLLPVSGPQGSGAAHILVVDDNDTNRLIAATLLDMFGCTHASAVNGREAVERAGVEEFDLILMDIKMPLMDGVEATRTLRSGGGVNRATPVLAVTANTDAFDIARYFEVGMAGVVAKPLKADDLMAAIGRVLDGADGERALCA